MSFHLRTLAYAWGEPVASRTCLLGETFSPTEAYGLGIFTMSQFVSYRAVPAYSESGRRHE